MQDKMNQLEDRFNILMEDYSSKNIENINRILKKVDTDLVLAKVHNTDRGYRLRKMIDKLQLKYNLKMDSNNFVTLGNEENFNDNISFGLDCKIFYDKLFSKSTYAVNFQINLNEKLIAQKSMYHSQSDLTKFISSVLFKQDIGLSGKEDEAYRFIVDELLPKCEENYIEHLQEILENLLTQAEKLNT